MTAPARPSSNVVMRRALAGGALLAVAVAVIGGPIGYAVAGVPGLVGALLGALMAFVFLGATAASILLANRFAGTDAYLGIFFGIVMGSFVLKLIVFLVAAVLLRDQPWVDTKVLFLTLIVGIVGSLVVDVLVVSRTRISTVSDLPPERRID
jgi:fructose-specific phosphotransferase system IIC component